MADPVLPVSSEEELKRRGMGRVDPGAVARFFAGMVSPGANTLGAAGVAGIRSMLPGSGSFRQELDAYNQASAPEDSVTDREPMPGEGDFDFLRRWAQSPAQQRRVMETATSAGHLGSGGVIPKGSPEYDANLAKFMDGSKVTEPVYHGTVSDFSEFDPRTQKRGEFGYGFYFADDAAGAGKRAESVAQSRGGAPGVMPAHLRIRKPLVIPSPEYYDWFDAQGFKSGSFDSSVIADAAKRSGYDGIIADWDNNGGRQFVVFDPAQIKSAIGNRGTFDPTDPNIMHGVLPLVGIGAAGAIADWFSRKEDEK